MNAPADSHLDTNLDRSSRYYNDNADRVVQLYESVRFEDVHAGILDLLPAPPGKVLDVGAGSGRDAAAFAKLGFDVTAVEPAHLLRGEAKKLHRGLSIAWEDDALPHLRSLGAQTFDLILVSAVWMHLPDGARGPAMMRLRRLLSQHGQLVITFREGPADPARAFSPVHLEDVLVDAQAAGLRPIRQLVDIDRLGRGQFSWRTVVLSASPTRPDSD